jgi:hypothetical protein
MKDDELNLWMNLSQALRQCRQKLWNIQKDQHCSRGLHDGITSIGDFLMQTIQDAEMVIEIEKYRKRNAPILQDGEARKTPVGTTVPE